MGDEDIFDEDPKDRKQETELVKKPSHRVQLLIGLSIFIIVGVLIALAIFGIIDVMETEPFDGSLCGYGVHSDFFGERCITEQEFIDLNNFEEIEEEPIETPTQIETPVIDRGSFKEVESISNTPVSVPAGYYMITSKDSWYGDFIDGREVPRKIDLTTDSKLNFKCYTDDHLGTSTYFGTFRNNVQNDLTVKVYIEGLEVDSRTTNTNRAIIVEGSCY